MKVAFNLKKVIWMKEGIIDDQQSFVGKLPGDVFSCGGTGGHVDEFVRFVGPNTVILASVLDEERDHPIASISHKKLEENYEILIKETDQDGNPLNIIRLPLPPMHFIDIQPKDGMYEIMESMKFIDGSKIDGPFKIITASSYCNFLVTNNLVLVAKYYKEGGNLLTKHTDELTVKTLSECFPGREIVQIECELLNIGGGGMHCITQQEPRL